jgi:hypothetical protein
METSRLPPGNERPQYAPGRQTQVNDNQRQTEQGGSPMRHRSSAKFPCRYLKFAVHAARISGQDMVQIVCENGLSAPFEIGKPD